jgi:hypothetical protein
VLKDGKLLGILSLSSLIQMRLNALSKERTCAKEKPKRKLISLIKLSFLKKGLLAIAWLSPRIVTNKAFLIGVLIFSILAFAFVYTNRIFGVVRV